MAETLLTVAETAALLETSERTVQRNAMAGKYGELRFVESTGGGGRGVCCPCALRGAQGDAGGGEGLQRSLGQCLTLATSVFTGNDQESGLLNASR